MTRHKYQKIFPQLFLTFFCFLYNVSSYGQNDINKYSFELPVANHVVYPKSANIIDVTKAPFNAKGDGVSDDTKAIQLAIWEALSRPERGDDKHAKISTLFFPKGTYLISNTLLSKRKENINMAFLVIQGENRDSTIIKLKDSLPKFQNVNSPASMLFMVSIHNPAWYKNRPEGDSLGEGHVAFFNDVCNITFNTGKGNNGAIALNYHASNNGTVKDVVIRSGDGNGICGLDMTRANVGPSLIKNVLIDGFDYGIKVSTHYINTFEYIILTNQKETAFLHEGEGVSSIRKLFSKNIVAGLGNINSNGQVAIIESCFKGGNNDNAAIINSGSLFARDIVTNGYATSIISNGKVIKDNLISEFVSDKVVELFPSEKRSLKLTIEETPEYSNSNLDDWASVLDYGANPNDMLDDSKAIQKAIDAGKPVVYFPTPESGGQYIIKSTVHVRGAVRLIEGMYSKIIITDGGNLDSYDNPQAAIKIENGDGSNITINRLQMGLQLGRTSLFSFIGVEQSTTRDLIIKNTLMPRFRNSLGCGKLFLENVSTHHSLHHNFEFLFPQNVWARHFNPEDFTHTKVLNNGGNFWVLGLKAERPSVLVRTLNGGKTEVIGGFAYPNHHVPFDLPIFYAENSSQSLTFSSTAVNDLERWRNVVREKRNQEVKTLTIENSPKLESEIPAPMVSLFTGFSPEINMPYIAIEPLEKTLTCDKKKVAFKVYFLKNAPESSMEVTVSLFGTAISKSIQKKIVVNANKEVVFEQEFENGAFSIMQSKQLYATIEPNQNLVIATPNIAVVNIINPQIKPSFKIGKSDFWVSADGNVLFDSYKKVSGIVNANSDALRLTIREPDRFVKFDSIGINGKPALSFYQNFLFLPQQLGVTEDSIINEKTITAVIKTSKDVNDKQTILELGSANRGINIYIENGRLLAGVWQNVFPKSLKVGPFLPTFLETEIEPEKCYLISLVFSGTERYFKLYVNGKLINEKIGVGPLALFNEEDMNAVGATYFSSRYTNSSDVRRFGCYYFNGKISEILIQNKVSNNRDFSETQKFFLNKYNLLN